MCYVHFYHVPSGVQPFSHRGTPIDQLFLAAHPGSILSSVKGLNFQKTRYF